ncbi:hypothetical protein ACFV27_36915 [Streptomyces antimycoticus]|uniref:hypothetical protein n=1 Tax=Streptomyces antimycoticus TaxID=68175 RepID=UPI0036C87D03
MTTTDETWACPANPFNHNWDDTGVRCSLCGTERTAAAAITSLVGSHRGWSVERAERLAAAHRAEVLRDELQPVLTESPCTHGATDDEHPTCPTIRVHADDADRFAAMVDMLHEVRVESEKRRQRMAAAETDLLDIRGTLSPNGFPRRVPMELGKTIAPVIEWLLDERDELAARADKAEAERDRATRAFEALTERHDAAKIERDELEKRVAELENGPLTVYRTRRVVGDRGADLGYYHTREQARDRCIAELRARGPQLVPDVIFDWIGQGHIEVLNISTPDEPCPDVTDYVVVEITVSGTAADEGAVR